MLTVGLVRFATKKYTNGLQYLNQQYVHLTNYSINRYSDKYIENNFESLVLLGVEGRA